MRWLLLLIVAPLWAQAPLAPSFSPIGNSLAIACVGSPGNTTGVFGQQCKSSGNAIFVCSNSAGCTVAVDWVASAVGIIACAGTPGTTTGSYRQQCQTTAGTVYACNNVAGCTVAVDWTTTGGFSLPTPGATCTFAANSTICVATTTATITVPVPVAGYQFCALNDDNVSTVITLSAIGTSARYENQARSAYGTAGTGTLVSGGAVGDMVCIVGRDSTHYLTMTSNGVWTAN